MYKPKRILYFHTVLVFFTFVYLARARTAHASRPAAATEATEPVDLTTTTTAAASSTSSTASSSSLATDQLLLEEPSDEQGRHFKRQIDQLARELFHVKDLPSQAAQTNTKAYVPRAMLEEYIKMRDSVREVIPDDRDFYGKINIDDLDQADDDFWKEVYNRYGSYNLEIDMGPPDAGPARRPGADEPTATHIAHVGTLGNPQDVPSNIEPILPPHSRSMFHQKKYLSVHLKFNLSQEYFAKPGAADELTKAELHIARERLYDCEYYNCDTRRPVPFFSGRHQPQAAQQQQQQQQQESTSGEDQGDEQATTGAPPDDIPSNRLHNLPRFQRIYILHIQDYDDHEEPMTRIHSSQRLDTHESSPIVVNIYSIVKYWLANPDKNFGVIVRVTNDDLAYDRQLESYRKSRPPRASNASVMIENDDEFMVPPEVAVAEHVRLKREFRQTSADSDTWLRKQPSLLLYSKKAESARKHVKRHHADDGHTDGMQSDNPETITPRDYSTTSTASSLSGPTGGSGGGNGVADDGQQRSTSEASQQQASQATTESQISARPLSSTGGSVASRREYPVASGGGRRGQQSGHHRNSGGSRAQGQQHGGPGGANSRPRAKIKPSARQNEKCSKRTLAINFDEVGWSSWIIAPQAYHANYCAGDCSWPLTDVQNATNHAIIQAIYHSVHRVVPRSCCAPVKLGRMAILYQLDGIVQMRQYDDMIVEACGCL